jgi:hypothetical protein
MPSLKNARHEAFAQQLVLGQKHGWTRGTCYSRAGYASEGTTAEVCASKLLAIAKNGISARVQEIVGAGAKRAETTVASLLRELEAAREGATDDRQFSAATQAIIAKAKLTGLMVDRLAIGSPSEFAACETTEDVMRTLLADQSPAEALASLDILRDEIERYAGDHADVAVAVKPVRPREPGGEADQRLALFRSAKQRRR